LVLTTCIASASAQSGGESVEYRVLATARTSTMEKELNTAAEAGFRFRAVMGGETALGGKEVVAVMSVGEERGRYAYRLLAAARTSTMQKELQQAADAGYHYQAQTVFKTALGGDEVVVILERDRAAAPQAFDYRLLATSKTSTLEKELADAGAAGYQIVGLTVGRTAVGGRELVAIARKPKGQ
jgi:hypothetical protein